MKRGLLLAACLALLPAAAIAESGTVVRATHLVAAPYADAATLGILRGETAVEIIERRGGWYQVTGAGRTGWVRLSNIRLGEVEAGEEGGFWASLFSFTGRTQARTASATTGIRGLSEEEIRNAVPDNAAVTRLAQFAPDDAEARRFAAEIGLEAHAVKPLPEKAPSAADGGAR